MQAASTLIWRAVTTVRSVELPLTGNVVESGVRFRWRRQVPIVADGGVSVRGIVGSVRNLKVERGILRGDVRWGSDKAAQTIKNKVEDGHLRFRLDITELEVMELRSGQTYLGFKGPRKLVTRWMPTSVLLVAGE